MASFKKATPTVTGTPEEMKAQAQAKGPPAAPDASSGWYGGGTPSTDPTLNASTDWSTSTGLPEGTVEKLLSDPSGAGGIELQQIALAKQNQGTNQNLIGGLGTTAQGADNAATLATQADQGVVNTQAGDVAGLGAGLGAIVGNQAIAANSANTADQADLAAYGQNLGAATGMQLDAYGQLASTYGGMSQLSATQQSSDVQAALAQQTLANYQNAGYTTAQQQTAGYQDAQYQSAVAENAALNRAGYTTANTAQANTNLANYQSANANAGDVASEQAALGQLSNIAGGSLNVQNGANAPEAYADQLGALQQYKDLAASPQATAQEKFLYEQQRETQEQQESSSRAALMNSYNARGMGGSGQELGSILQAGQQNSQQRLLGDLGTQAGAVNRQMQALQGYGNLSSALTTQGNALALGNASNQLTAAGQQGTLASTIRGQGSQENQFNANAYNSNSQFNANAANTVGMFNTGQSNSVGMFNADAANSNSQFNASQANNMNQFNVGQDNSVNMFNANAYNSNSQFNANAYNSNQQFNAAQGNDIGMFNADAYNSNQQFNAGAYNSNQQFNAGQANATSQFNANSVNSTNQFNTSQNMIQQRFSDQYAADQQQQAAQRASDLAGTGITVGQNFANNSTNAFNASTGVNQAGYGRTTDVDGMAGNALTDFYNGLTTVNGMQTKVNDKTGTDASDAYGRGVGIVTGLVDNNNDAFGQTSTAQQAAAGDLVGAKAADDAKNAPVSGPLGLWTTYPGKSGVSIKW